jgi:ANTAR domain-containing protein
MRLQRVLDAADIGIAVGVVVERDRVDPHRAFAFLVRLSDNRNVKLRALAHQVIDGTCESTPAEVRRLHGWP